METVTAIIDVVDVQETVANATDGPKPDYEMVEDWLADHDEGLEQAMRYAGMSYIRANFPRPKVKEK